MGGEVNARSAIRLLSGVLIAAAVPFCVVGASSASAPEAAEPLAGLNQIRAGLGLRPLGRDPVAQALVTKLGAGDVKDEPPQALDDQPACAVCAHALGPDGLGVAPGELYARRGGRGSVGFGLWRKGWTAGQNLSVFFRTAAMALDPRARTFSAAPTPRGLLVVAITIDAKSRLTAPVRWPERAIDPRLQLWVELLLPRGARGEARLVERRGPRTVTVASPLADTPGLGGSRLIAFGLNASLAYGHRYEARIGQVGLPLTTRPLPASLLRPSWRFADLTPGERIAFLRIFQRGPPLLRRIARELDGVVRVVGGRRGCFSADACEHLRGGQASISLGRVDPFVVLHEFGHVVLDLGLDEAGARAFEGAFIHSPLWRGGCCPYLHGVFADQFAFWALGGRPRGVISYGHPQLLSAARFGQMLAEHYGYRPRPILGPLPPPWLPATPVGR